MRKQAIFPAIFIMFFSMALSAQSTAEPTHSQAWILGSRLSVAGALHSQPGNNAELVNREFAKASAAAKAFGINKLPSLPAKKGNKVEDSAAALYYLLNTVGSPIGGILAKEYGAEHAAVFETALKANTLLILYGPNDSTTNTLAGVIRSRSLRVESLSSLTAPLLKLIDQKASYELIKKELLELNDTAPKFMALMRHIRDGEAKFVAKDYLGSVAAYTEGLAVNPSDIDCYLGRGRANLALRKYVDSAADLTKAIEIGKKVGYSPKNLYSVYHNRGLSYFLTGKNAMAIVDLNQAIKLQPDYALAFKLRGLIYQKMGNAKAAAADLDTAERLQPGITK